MGNGNGYDGGLGLGGGKPGFGFGMSQGKEEIPPPPKESVNADNDPRMVLNEFLDLVEILKTNGDIFDGGQNSGNNGGGGGGSLVVQEQGEVRATGTGFNASDVIVSIPQGYQEEEFDFEEGRSTSNINDTDDYLQIESPISDLLHPLKDLGINPGGPLIISSHEFLPSRLSGSTTFDSEEDFFDVYPSQVYTYRQYGITFYDLAGALIDQQEFNLGQLAYIMQTFQRNYVIDSSGTELLHTGRVTMNSEAEMSFGVDAYLSSWSSEYRNEVDFKPNYNSSVEVDPAYAGSIRNQYYYNTAQAEFNTGIQLNDRFSLDPVGLPDSLDGNGEWVNSLISGEKSISLRVDQMNMVQPYIARAMHKHLESWVGTKELIANMGNIITGAKYLVDRGVGTEGESTPYNCWLSDFAHPVVYKAKYKQASHRSVVQSHGYYHEGDLSIGTMTAGFVPIKDLLSNTEEDPLKTLFTQELGFTEGGGASNIASDFDQSTRTKLFSQLVYDLYQHIKWGGISLTSYEKLYYRQRPYVVTSNRNTVSTIPHDENQMRKTALALKSITPTESGAGYPSESNLAAFYNSLGSDTTTRIATVCAMLAKDYIQSIGLSHTDHHKSINAVYGSLFGSESEVSMDSSTTLDSYYDLIFDPHTSIETAGDFPNRGSLMSTAKVDIGESNFTGKELLPLESFVSPTNSTPEDQFTSGYDYFIDEMIACVKTREIGGGDSIPYSNSGFSDMELGPTPSHRPKMPYTNEESGSSKGYLTSLAFTAPNSYQSSSRERRDIDVPLNGEIMGTRHSWLMSNVLKITLSYMTGNPIFSNAKAFATVGSEATIGERNLFHYDYGDYAPLTQTFLAQMYRLADLSMKNFLKSFVELGTLIESFYLSDDASDTMLSLGILSAIARSDDADVKIKYMKYCDELYKLYQTDDRLDTVSVVLGYGVDPGGGFRIQNSYTDEYLSAINDLNSSSSDFVSAAAELAIAVIGEVKRGGTSGLESTVFEVEPMITPLGGEPVPDPGSLRDIVIRQNASYSGDSVSTSFSNVLLTPIGKALLEPSNRPLATDPVSILGLPALTINRQNLRSYFGEGNTNDLNIVSGPSSLTSDQYFLLNPGENGNIFPVSSAFGFNALTYVRGLSVAWLEILKTTIASDSDIFSFSMNYDAEDFSDLSPTYFTNKQFIEDGQFKLTVLTPEIHGFALAMHDASGNNPTPVETTSCYGVSKLGMASTGLQLLDSDIRGDSHFFGDDETFFTEYRNELYYPLNRINRSDSTMVMIAEMLQQIGNWWTVCSSNIHRPNADFQNAQWKKWLQYGAIMGATRQFGYMSSRESAACMQHYIREYLTYDSLPMKKNFDPGTSYFMWQSMPILGVSADIDHLGRTIGGNFYQHSPYNYPLGEKLTPRTRELVHKGLYGNGGFVSGVQTHSYGEPIDFGRSLVRESIEDVGKIITVGIPTGLLDKLRRKIHHNKMLVGHRAGAGCEGLTRMHDSLVKISIYKYDLENDDIFYPDPKVFTVSTAMFYPQAFPELAGTFRSYDKVGNTSLRTAYPEFGGYGKYVGSTEPHPHYHLMSIQCLIPEAQHVRDWHDEWLGSFTSAYKGASMCFASGRWSDATDRRAELDTRGGCAFLTLDQIPRKQIKRQAAEFIFGSGDHEPLIAYTAGGAVSETGANHGQGSHYIGIKSATFRNETYDSTLYYNTNGEFGWWNPVELPETDFFPVREGMDSRISSFLGSDFELLSRYPIHYYEKNWLYLRSDSTFNLTNGKIEDLFGTDATSPGYKNGGSSSVGYPYFKMGSAATGAGGILKVDPDTGGVRHAYTEDLYGAGYSARDILEAYVNCFKDAILKAIVKLDTGVDLREVGFPVFPADTSYDMGLEVMGGAEALGNASFFGRDSRTSAVYSKSATGEEPGFPTGVQLNAPMLLSMYDMGGYFPHTNYVNTGYHKTIGGLWGTINGFHRFWSSMGTPTTFTATVDPQVGERDTEAGRQAASWQSDFDYFRYLDRRTAMYNALEGSRKLELGYTGGRGTKDIRAMQLKTYRMGAPISRAKATLPNKFERTFSFFIDPNKDFVAHKKTWLARDEGGESLAFTSDDDFDFSAYGSEGGYLTYYYTTEYPDHVSNVYGFYATVEILDRNDSSR